MVAEGIVNDALGDELLFSMAIMIVMFFNFFYIFYNAYFATRISSMVNSDFYCKPTDMIVYRAATGGFIAVWTICVISYYAISIYKKCCSRHSTQAMTTDDNAKLMTSIEKKSQAWLKILVTTNFLDEVYFNHIQGEIDAHRPVNDSSSAIATTAAPATPAAAAAPAVPAAPAPAAPATITTTTTVAETTSRQDTPLPKTWRYCFMILKLVLIMLRIILCWLIIPLLQLQLFDDYAWNCLSNNIIRNYCETNNSQLRHYNTLDHSFVTYTLYMLLVIALLFTFMIEWLPKGYPKVTLKNGCIYILKE